MRCKSFLALSALTFSLAAAMCSCGGHSGKSGKGADTIALAPCPEFQADSAMNHIHGSVIL